MHSSNPTLGVLERDELFALTPSKTMTVFGTATKFGILVSLAAAAGVLAWTEIVEPAFQNQSSGGLMPWLLGSVIGTFVLSMVMVMNPPLSRFLAIPHALGQGVALAIVSGFIATRFGGQFADATGLIFQAIVLTFGIAAGLAVAYSAGLIRIGNTMAKVMIVAGAGLVVYWIALFLLNGLFGMNIPNLISSTSMLGIGFTAACLVLASLFLVLDFQFIERASQQDAPKYMEWYGAHALLVTVAWIYIEALRLLAKLRSR